MTILDITKALIYTMFLSHFVRIQNEIYILKPGETQDDSSETLNIACLVGDSEMLYSILNFRSCSTFFTEENISTFIAFIKIITTHKHVKSKKKKMKNINLNRVDDVCWKNGLTEINHIRLNIKCPCKVLVYTKLKSIFLHKFSSLTFISK